MISFELSYLFILVSCFFGLVWAIINAFQLSKIKVQSTNVIQDSFNKLSDQEVAGFQDEKSQLILEVASYIERGAAAFLHAEYRSIGMFVIIMAFVIFFAVEEKLGYLWTTFAFLLGAFTSILSGYVGMRVATFSNYRCTFKAQTSMTEAFRVAFRAGIVMGFSLTSFALLNLTILIALYANWYVSSYEDYGTLFECIAGYGLGGSTIALFGRVGGGIYTKAADVGADLVGKVQHDLNEDSPSNPATIADNVGDNVGDIAGMGADLFGSFAEATCAALVVASTSPSFYYQPSTLMYPLLISAFGIIVCIFTSLFAFTRKQEKYDEVQDTLKMQLFLSSFFMTIALYFCASWSLPDRIFGLSSVDRQQIHAWICTITGLWSGFIIGYVTEYYTSHSYSPVRELAESCITGAATNIIYGIALGNLSTVVPVIFLALTAFVSHTLLGMFGVALGALGMLCTMSIGLAIDAYGPVSDNAGGISEMCELGEETRKKTDQLDAAGNTTAAIGKGFAIGSAGLVAISLYGAFITRAQNLNNSHPILEVSITNPLIFAGLLCGAMLPYVFSAMTMKSVGKAAKDMVKEVQDQIRENPEIITGQKRPNYEKCIDISTKASLKEMIAPGALALFTPFIVGIFLGPTAIAGLLPGIIVSGITMATSSANAGGAWDNAKKYIESGALIVDTIQYKKGSDPHKAAVIGDTVGDPLKDTSGPSLNILVKLTAIFSLIFAGFFDQTALLQCIVAPLSGGCIAQ